MSFLLLVVLLPFAAPSCNPCTRCQYPVYDGFRHDADENVKNVVFGAGTGRAGFATPTFSRSYDSRTGCMLMHAQCFSQIGDTNIQLPAPPGDLINAQIPPILPPGSSSRARRQTEDHLYNYFIWTAAGRNHSLQSYWDHQRGDISHATFRCNDQAQWEYEYGNKSIVQVRGIYCFWVPRELTMRAFGYAVPRLLASPVLHV